MVISIWHMCNPAVHHTGNSQKMIYNTKENVKMPHLLSHFPTCCSNPSALGLLAPPMNSHQLTLLSAFRTLSILGQATYPFWLEISPGSRATQFSPRRSVMNEKEGISANLRLHQWKYLQLT